MTNDFNLISSNEESTAFSVEVKGTVVGQVSLINDAWHYRLGKSGDWSSFGVGSEFEAAEFVLVESGKLTINANGVVVSHIKVQR
jgi:hypothetical protein